MIYIGIDPGITGAIAALTDFGRHLHALHDLPTVQRGKIGNKQQINGYELARILAAYKATDCHVYLELVKGMPRMKGGKSAMGATSAFNFGETFGCIRGVLEALALPYTLVPPERWKKRAGLIGAEKDASRMRALQLFPNHAHRFARKKDVGRAEALLIATFGPEVPPPGAMSDPFELESDK